MLSVRPSLPAPVPSVYLDLTSIVIAVLGKVLRVYKKVNLKGTRGHWCKVIQPRQRLTRDRNLQHMGLKSREVQGEDRLIVNLHGFTGLTGGI